MERQWRATLAESRAISAKATTAQESIPAWARPGRDSHGYQTGWPEIDRTHPAFRAFVGPMMLSSRPSLSEIRRFNRGLEWQARKPEALAWRKAQGRERVRHWIARQREKQALESQAGLAELDARQDATLERLYAIETRIIEMPARTAAGIAVKLRLYGHYAAFEDTPREDLEDSALTILSALADAERLGGVS